MWLIVLSRFWRRLPRLLRFLSRLWRSTLQCVLNSGADFRGEVFSLQFIPNLGAIFRRKIYRIEVGRLDPIVRGEEKQDTCEKIETERMHVTHAMSGEKLVRQFPRANQEKPNRCEKLRGPIQEFVE